MTAIAIPLRISGVAVEQAVLGVALLASIACVWGNSQARMHFFSALTSLQGKLIFAVFISWAVVIPFSADPSGSFEIGGRTGLFILAAAVVGSTLKSVPERRDLVWKVLVVSAVGFGFAAVCSLLGWGQILALLTADFDGETNVGSILKPYATAVVCMLPVVIFAGRKLSGFWQYLGYAYLPIAVVIVLLTENRSAAAGMMAVTVVFFLLLLVGRGRSWRGILAAVLAVVSTTILWVRYERSDYATQFDEITYLPGWLIDPHRQNIWRFAYNKFLDHPWVGNGIDQMNKLPGAHEVVQGLGGGAYYVPSHPHNWMIEIAGEVGLIGFIPVLLALGYMVWKTVKAYMASHDQMALTKILVIVGFLTCSLFSYSIWAVWWQLVFYMLIAILWSSEEMGQGQPTINEAST